jgi:hypothetical protein
VEGREEGRRGEKGGGSKGAGTEESVRNSRRKTHAKE